MRPAVSVVMAAKNYARFLPMAVASVQAQTFADWELVIIDDGSTDDTSDAVRPFLNDERIHFTKSDLLGQSRAKNLGVRLSQGDVIAFMDADDAWLPTKLAKQLPLLSGDVGVVHCERELIDENCLDTKCSAATSLPVAAKQIDLDAIYIANPICFSSTMVKRIVLDHVGGFNPELDLSIDYDLWLRVAKHYDIACVPEKLVLYRTGHGNLSKKLADRIATAFSIMHRNSEGVSAAARNEAYAMTCRSMAWAVRGAEPMHALQWYANALAWPHRRGESLRGILGTLADRFRVGRVVSAENLSANA
ncbi:N/A [soil metagenome]